MPFAITSTNEEKVKVTVSPMSHAGHPAPVDGALTVAVVSGNGTVTQDPAEPNSFVCVSADNDEGDTVYSVSADADLGPGTAPITDTVVYTVTRATAASLGFSAEAATPK